MLQWLLAISLFVHPAVETFAVRGQPQQLRLYGPSTGQPIIVASGDGGWIHLAPHVAEQLASRGAFVLGFDSRAYLMDFTRGSGGLTPAQVQADFEALVLHAAHGGARPILVGVSEGAGLAVLAAVSPAVRARIAGIVALGLSDRNEMAWRWKDAVIYLTKGVPNEPLFTVTSVLPQVRNLPMALIQSTHDEYVPPSEADRIFRAAQVPKRLWTVDATDHRFSNNLTALDRALANAIDWIRGTDGNSHG